MCICTAVTNSFVDNVNNIQYEYKSIYTAMWFEIIPPFLIITAGVGLPGAALWWLHYLTLGNHYRRSLHSRWDRRAYQRDRRLTGNPYEVNGLDSIPD